MLSLKHKYILRSDTVMILTREEFFYDLRKFTEDRTDDEALKFAKFLNKDKYLFERYFPNFIYSQITYSRIH